MELNSIFVHFLTIVLFWSDTQFVLSRQRDFFICCQSGIQIVYFLHKPTTLVTQNVILIGSVASEKNLFKYVGGLSWRIMEY